jgi:probable rRNA maturation factor
MLVIVNQSSVRVPRKFLDELFHRLNKNLKLKNRDLTLVFLNKNRARALNKQFRHKDYATDVLSFADESEETLGELILCPQVLKAQAKEHDLSYQSELMYMVIHGVLHLLGYEHEGSARKAKEMFTLQDRLFERYLKIY